MRRLTTAAMLLLAVALAGCNLSQIVDSSEPDDVAATKGIGSGWTGDSAGSGGGPGTDPQNNQHPLVGEWHYNSACGSPAITLTLNSTREGRIWYKDCAGVCPATGQVGVFNWSATGLASGSLTLTYRSLTICGQPANTPAADSRPYSFSGPNLQFAGVSWAKVD